MVIGAVLLASFLFVPEAYRPEGMEDDIPIFEDDDNTYFVEKDGNFELYLGEERLLIFSYIPDEFSDLPVIEMEEG